MFYKGNMKSQIGQYFQKRNPFTIDKITIASRKVITAKFIIAFSISMLFVFSTMHFINESMTMFYVDTSIFFLLTLLIFRFKPQLYTLAHWVLTLMGLTIIVLLVISKGQEYSPIWSFIYIYFAMILYGYKVGGIVAFVYSTFLLIILFSWVGDTLSVLEYFRFFAVIGVSVLFTFISEYIISVIFFKLSKTQKKLEKISHTDGLTKVYNRRYFDVLFPKEIGVAKTGEYLLAFIMLDVDYFKQYNDSYGHQAGDEVLIKLAGQLKRTMRSEQSAIFRLGGEEFGLLYLTVNKEDAVDFAKLIIQDIAKLHIPHNKSKVSEYLTASAGLYIINPDDGISKNEAYKICDQRLYKAKANGRNQLYIGAQDRD